jgi:hypothetical protein
LQLTQSLAKLPSAVVHYSLHRRRAGPAPQAIDSS